MNKNNEIHKLEMKHHKMYRKLSGNEVKDFINNFYKLKVELGDNWYDNEWMNLTLFCINDFGKCKYLREIIYDLDFDEIEHHARLYCKFMKLNEKDFMNREIKFFYFLTATGKDKIKVNEENIGKMYKLNKNIFNNDHYKRFHKVYWNIETGKNINDSNLHTHALIIFDKTNKNFERDYKSNFKKAFGNIDLDIQKFGWRGNKEIYDDKYNYLKNIGKSILHKNYEDLEIFEYVE